MCFFILCLILYQNWSISTVRRLDRFESSCNISSKCHLKALVFLYAFAESVDCHLLYDELGDNIMKLFYGKVKMYRL